MSVHAKRINEIVADILQREAGTFALALEAGKLLKAEKKQVGHGNWLPWLNPRECVVRSFAHAQC
jgi:hypothetical protein